VSGSRPSNSLRGPGLPGEDELGAGLSNLGLAYLFAAAGAGRIAGQGFETFDLPARGMVAIPASSPAFVVEDAGGLDLIRITPNWPKETQSGQTQ
jgi:hypothetical protein